MEQVITVRIIDAPQTHNGSPFDVLAERGADEITVTDTPGNPDQLGENIAAGVLALRGIERRTFTPYDPDAIDRNVAVIDAATVATCPSARLRGLLPPDRE
jgi:hypothetical protein